MILKFYGSEKSTIAKLMRRSIEEHTYLQLSVKDKNIITSNLMSYLLQISDFNTLNRQIKMLRKLSVQDIHNLRKNMVAGFDCGLALKQVVLLYLQAKKNKKTLDLVSVLKRASLPASDISIILNLKSLGIYEQALAKLKDVKVDIVEPNQVHKECGVAVREIGRFIENFSRKKLTFISTSNQMASKNEKPLDMISDVTELAVQAYYRCTPFKTDLHRKNTMIQTVHNKGMKMINHYTSLKRKRIDENGLLHKGIHSPDTFGPCGVSTNDTNDSERSDVILSALQYEGSINAEYNLIDTSLSIQKYIEERKSPGLIKVVKLLTIQSDDDFVAFCKKKSRMRSLEDTECVYTKLGLKKYLQCISEYTLVPIQTLNRILAELKQNLAVST